MKECKGCKYEYYLYIPQECFNCKYRKHEKFIKEIIGK